MGRDEMRGFRACSSRQIRSEW